MGTEEKLSAIKAINEEKEKVESMLEVLHSWSGKVDEVCLGNVLEGNSVPFIVTPAAGADAKRVLVDYYEVRLKQLIKKAEELFKPEP